jgi:hypothetical protein
MLALNKAYRVAIKMRGDKKNFSEQQSDQKVMIVNDRILNEQHGYHEKLSKDKWPEQPLWARRQLEYEETDRGKYLTTDTKQEYENWKNLPDIGGATM